MENICFFFYVNWKSKMCAIVGHFKHIAHGENRIKNLFLQTVCKYPLDRKYKMVVTAVHSLIGPYREINEKLFLRNLILPKLDGLGTC